MTVIPSVIGLGDRDNVVVAIRPLITGEQIVLANGQSVTALDAVPFGHKLATRPIVTGGEVIKYDEVIGIASSDIPLGGHVHVHNVVSARLPGAGR